MTPSAADASVYASTVSLPFGFVTFTPNCLARAIISTRFLDDTECAILEYILGPN